MPVSMACDARFEAGAIVLLAGFGSTGAEEADGAGLGGRCGGDAGEVSRLFVRPSMDW